MPAKDYRDWFATLPAELTDAMVEHWGPPPGELFVDRSPDPDGEIVIAAMQAGNVVLMVQPPRGFGENPVAIYHDPDLPPSHHYLAAYRWLDAVFGADAVVHLGKHGNLEWLPGKTLGMSAACGTDAALGDLPLIYPFLVNDPGEGTQAKRRAHATLVDHLIPPMARAESYGDIARLEQLLDEHANIAALDPGKLPAIRQQIWTLMRAAKMDHDLGLEDRPDEDSFDDMLLHVDGWLCEIKDVQIRDGLHILGEKPTGEPEIDLVLAILRARQLFGGEQSVPGLRQALGLAEDGHDERAAVDAAEAQARELVAALAASGWDPAAVDAITDNAEVAAILRFAATEVVPRLAGTAAEIPQILRALDGRFIAAGPSGSPLRGLVNVLPTGRNFYSVDPKAVPSRLAWETGVAMADSLLDALPRGPRRLAAVGRIVGVGHVGHAHLGRRHRRSACAARGPAGMGRRIAAGGRPGADRARPNSAARASTSPCASRVSSATPSRTWSRCSTTRCSSSRASTSPPRTTTSAPTRRPTSPSTATKDVPPQEYSAPSRAPTARGCCS